MSGFVKLYGTVLDSTVWVGTDKHIKLVWITLLAMADGNGFVEASLPGIAKRAEVSVAECKEALHMFTNPDIESKSQVDEGRRVAKVERGWTVINHRAYRDLRTAAQVQEAEKKQRWRDKARLSLMQGDKSGQSTKSTGEAEAEAEAEKERSTTSVGPRDVEEDVLFETFWRTYPKRNGSDPKNGARICWAKNRKGGVEPDDMIAGAQRYALWTIGTGKQGTETIMQAKRFLGQERAWEQGWVLPTNGQKPSGDYMTRNRIGG